MAMADVMVDVMDMMDVTLMGVMMMRMNMNVSPPVYTLTDTAGQFVLVERCSF